MAVLHALRAAMGSPSQVLTYSAEAARESGAQRRANAPLQHPLPGVARGLLCVHWTPPTGNLAKSYQDLTEALRENVYFRLDKKKTQRKLSLFLMESGSDLLSRAVSSQVPSAC